MANRNHNRQGIGAWIGIEGYEFMMRSIIIPAERSLTSREF